MPDPADFWTRRALPFLKQELASYPRKTLLGVVALAVAFALGFRIKSIKLGFFDLVRDAPASTAPSSSPPTTPPMKPRVIPRNKAGNKGAEPVAPFKEELTVKLRVEKIRQGPADNFDLLHADIVNVGTTRVVLDEEQLLCDQVLMGRMSMAWEGRTKTGDNTFSIDIRYPTLDPGDKTTRNRIIVYDPKDNRRILSWEDCGGLVEVRILTTRGNTFNANIQRGGKRPWLYQGQ